MTERLTTLAAVKDWLDIPHDDSDTALVRLIDSASQFVLNQLNRESFWVRPYTQNFRGNGKTYTLLANWPVVSITSVGIGGLSVPVSVEGNAGLPGAGFRLSDDRRTYQSVELYGGYGFTMGAPSQIIYTSGFSTTDTPTLPAPVDGKLLYTPTKDGQWSHDRGVSHNGVKLLLVKEDPAVTEYSVDEWGTYTFNIALEGEEVEISYDFTPFDVSFAVTELIGEWYRRKDRIGQLSKTLGGQETVTFSQKDMSDSIKTALQTYKNVVPI